MNTSQDFSKFQEYKIVFNKDVESRDTPFRDTLVKRSKPLGTTLSVSELIERDLPIVRTTVGENEQLPRFEVVSDTVNFQCGIYGAIVGLTVLASMAGQFNVLKYVRERLVKQCADSLEYQAYLRVYKTTPNTVTIPATGALVFSQSGATTASTGELTFDRIFEMQAHLSQLAVPNYQNLNLYTNYKEGAGLMKELFEKNWATESGRMENKKSSFRTFDVFGIKIKIIPFPYTDDEGNVDSGSYFFSDNPGVELILAKEELSHVVLPNDSSRFQEVSWKCVIGFERLPGARVWRINPRA